MKKIVALLLLMVSTSVFAEWVAVGASSDGMTLYGDYGTIKRKGNKVKMWRLYDFKTFQKGENVKYLSMVTRDEYDCEEETSQMLDVYWYSSNMKSGEVVFSDSNIRVEPKSIVPRSVNETLFNIACDKK